MDHIKAILHKLRRKWIVFWGHKDKHFYWSGENMGYSRREARKIRQFKIQDKKRLEIEKNKIYDLSDMD